MITTSSYGMERKDKMTQDTVSTCLHRSHFLTWVVDRQTKTEKDLIDKHSLGEDEGRMVYF